MPRLALITWLLLLARWTLTPAPEAAAAADLTPWWCISCGEIGTADLLQNLLLFLPVGALLRQIGWSAGRAILCGFVITLAIELTQATLLPGRDAALGDLLANVAGTAAGWALLPALWAIAFPTAATAPRVAAVPLVVFALQLLASSWLLRPAPGGAPWTTERAPQHRDGTKWPGIVGEVALGQSAEGVTFTATTSWPSPAPTRRATVARLTRGPLDGVAGVTVAPGMAAASLRTHARAVRLRSPVGQIPLPQVMATETLTVRLTHRPGALTVAAAASSGATSDATVPIGAQHGWVLINPFTPTVALLTAWERWTLAWLVGWGLLLGYGAGASRRWPSWAIGGALVGLGIPALTGSPLALLEVVGLAAAWALAAAFGRMRRRGHSTVE
jgi:hypothetical protein